MTGPDGDRDLREAFQALRRADLAGTPTFLRVAESRPRPVGGLRLVWGVAVAVVLLVAAFGPLRAALRTRAELRMARQVMAWRSPTAFLLDAPVSDFLATIPAIGRSPAGSPLHTLDPGGALAPSTQRSPL